MKFLTHPAVLRIMEWTSTWLSHGDHPGHWFGL